MQLKAGRASRPAVKRLNCDGVEQLIAEAVGSMLRLVECYKLKARAWRGRLIMLKPDVCAHPVNGTISGKNATKQPHSSPHFWSRPIVRGVIICFALDSPM